MHPEDDDDTRSSSGVPAHSWVDPDLEDTRIGPAVGLLPGSIEPEPSHVQPVYSFRIGVEGERIALDRPVIIGRRPAAPRIPFPLPPRLVSVVSPTSEVSSTHLELRQVGASVVATDQRSTNGSVVVIPGSAPRQLRQGESLVVTPGTLIDIGDGNRLEVLSPRVVAPPVPSGVDVTARGSAQ
ncbi:FHA domain-containing protein [Glaciihabitans arcticus]|uniref:FHA domain-containing protein n=1 Tax=Glaciihabitans arcticus TaxID=2668039 RepID=A0A4Q9GQQ2_9MICO|nr:FHA domain-containing protein [Glaciihabitans arcticus]TBN56334.1 FHA domain-containing protein [Glaciihabitans arcticus]